MVILEFVHSPGGRPTKRPGTQRKPDEAPEQPRDRKLVVKQIPGVPPPTSLISPKHLIPNVVLLSAAQWSNLLLL